MNEKEKKKERKKGKKKGWPCSTKGLQRSGPEYCTYIHIVFIGVSFLLFFYHTELYIALFSDMGLLRTASRGMTASASGGGGGGGGGSAGGAWDGSPTPKPGQYTRTIYGLIRDDKLQDAIAVLQRELQVYPESRAALSLLGFCSFQLSQFAKAAEYYQSLVRRSREAEEGSEGVDKLLGGWVWACST